LLCELSRDCKRPVWTHLTEHKGVTVDKRDKDKDGREGVSQTHTEW